MDEILKILRELDWSPLYISLKTGVVATIISFFLGIFAARKVVKAGPRVKAIADGILTLPMVLPPTVAGFFLLLLFSRRRPLGIFLFENFDIKVVQTWLGCIIAATVIAFPLMYRNARAAFELVDVNLIYAARTLGMGEVEIFWEGGGSGQEGLYPVRHHPDFCKSYGGIRRYIHAGRKYSRKNRNDLPEDRHGHPGWRLLNGGHLGYCNADCLWNRVPDESGIRKAHEADEAVVA